MTTTPAAEETRCSKSALANRKNRILRDVSQKAPSGCRLASAHLCVLLGYVQLHYVLTLTAMSFRPLYSYNTTAAERFCFILFCAMNKNGER